MVGLDVSEKKTSDTDQTNKREETWVSQEIATKIEETGIT